MSRFDEIKALYGENTLKKITECKVLMVGAGGIGCELLKSLVLFGFKYIEIIDLGMFFLVYST